MRSITLSAVIPCFNEAPGLELLVRRVDAVVAAVTPDYEIVLVDDGSTDGGYAEMRRLRALYPALTLVKLSRNYGHQLALSAGLAEARGTDYIFILDADLQDPPEALPEMLRIMDSESADVVYGRRNRRAGESWFKRFSAGMFYRVLRFMTDISIPMHTGDFRLMRRKVLDALLQMPEHARFIRGMISWVGFKQVPYYYDRAARKVGVTKYPLGKMLKLSCDAITSFSVKPLRIGVFLGLFGVIVALLLLIYCFVSYFFFDTVAGWTSIIAVVILVGALQFVLLGLIGEYVGRIFIETQNRPLFVVDKIERGES